MAQNVNDEAEEMSIQHRELIEEEGINISDLPDEIKKDMRNFNSKLKEYEENLYFILCLFAKCCSCTKTSFHN